MIQVHLETIIHAPVAICFDLSRSIDLHMASTAHTNEKAIAGCLSGLISLGESVTWEATHFKLKFHLTSFISKMEPPFYFRDEMITGPFKSMKHDHCFHAFGENTIMQDHFEFKSPFGFAGTIADRFILRKYLTELLNHRNEVIKSCAESNQWKKYLNHGKQELL